MTPMAFRYQPFQNPYISSMTDLMGRGTEARSRAALSAAEAQAGGALRLGDLTQQKWSGLGDTIGQGIDAYVTEQRAKPQREYDEWRRQQEYDAAARREEAQALLGRVSAGRNVRDTPVGDMLALQTDTGGEFRRTPLGSAPQPSRFPGGAPPETRRDAAGNFVRAEPELLPAQTIAMDRDPYGVERGGIRLFNVEKYIQEAAVGGMLPESAEFIDMMRGLNTDKINQVQQGLQQAQTQGNQLIAMGNEGILSAGAEMLAHWKDTVPETHLRPLEMALDAGNPDEFRRVLRGFTGLQPHFVSAEPGQQMLETTAGTYSQVPGQRRFTPGSPESRIQNEITIQENALGRQLTVAEKNKIETRIAASTQPQRAGYFTMLTRYDAQGRPAGAIVLDARTGLARLVDTEELGGYTAKPPGNLAQRTIENEASLDSLERLKGMFTTVRDAEGKIISEGAEADIGPAEGRFRQALHSMPGGIAVLDYFNQEPERFAAFNAATRAFQNAMIKAITGAQMSEPEAKRIMGQIPNVTDNPVDWLAKYDESVLNLQDLENRLRIDRDAGRDVLPPSGVDYDALFEEVTGHTMEVGATADISLDSLYDDYAARQGGR